MSVWTPNMHLSIEGDQVPIPHSTVSLLRVEVLQRSRSPEASSFSESCLACWESCCWITVSKEEECFLETEAAVTQPFREWTLKSALKNRSIFSLTSPKINIYTLNCAQEIHCLRLSYIYHHSLPPNALTIYFYIYINLGFSCWVQSLLGNVIAWFLPFPCIIRQCPSCLPAFRWWDVAGLQSPWL